MGHRAVKDLLTVDVNVEEKIDGSQFSFGVVPVNADVDTVFKTIDGVDYALKIRSKGCVMHIDAPEKMFNAAAETVRRLADLLTPSWTYRSEFLGRPKHNSLAYDRVPKDYIIIFDVSTGEQEYLSYEDKVKEANRLGLEVVPLLYSGRVETIEQFRKFFTVVSILGGQAIEGVVVKPKNYDLFGTDKKLLLGKLVSERFKEIHAKAWRENNPTNKDVIQRLAAVYGTKARWFKALQHLEEAGEIEWSPRDIGKLIKEVPLDILKECEEEIKDKLMEWAWPHLRRMLTRELPIWYKEDVLLKRQFED
jgi:hypothetical protein